MDARVASSQPPQTYEPPRVETVMTAEDLAREVKYAGEQSVPVDFAG
jgi:hypothetical protein